MERMGSSDTLGTGLGLARAQAELALEVALAVWDLSARLARWVARQCRQDPVEERLQAGAGGLRGERTYALSTVRRYRQIAARFTHWDKKHRADDSATPDVAGYLAALAEAPGHGDPRHLGLLRTTLCALRTTLEEPPEPELTAGLRLPPRPRPVRAAAPATVAALRRAARDRREKLLVILACDLGLRPGQMTTLRWGDICLAQRRLYLDGRHGREEIVLSGGALSRLTACARGRAADELLFPSPQGENPGAATVRTLQNALRRLAGRAGVPPGTTFASLRKTCSAGPAPSPRCNGRVGSRAGPSAAARRPVPGAAAVLPPSRQALVTTGTRAEPVSSAPAEELLPTPPATVFSALVPPSVVRRGVDPPGRSGSPKTTG